jgi:hypothetical protein
MRPPQELARRNRRVGRIVGVVFNRAIEIANLQPVRAVAFS